MKYHEKKLVYEVSGTSASSESFPISKYKWKELYRVSEKSGLEFVSVAHWMVVAWAHRRGLLFYLIFSPNLWSVYGSYIQNLNQLLFHCLPPRFMFNPWNRIVEMELFKNAISGLFLKNDQCAIVCIHNYCEYTHTKWVIACINSQFSPFSLHTVIGSACAIIVQLISLKNLSHNVSKFWTVLDWLIIQNMQIN